MKFGYAFTEYLQEEREWLVDEKCAHIEYVRLKKVLKRCQRDTSLHKDQLCQCQSCPLCDQKFFSELMKEASDIVGYFSSRVKHLLHLHIATGLQRYVLRLSQCFKNDSQALAQEGRILFEYIAMNAIAMRKILKKYDKVHSSTNGENFKSRMHAEHIELLHSPWLIELGAFYLNSSGLNDCEIDGVYGHFLCDLNINKAAMTLILPDSIKLEYDLTCAICLSCACSAASVMIFQGLKAASPESKCPICREVGVYSKAVHMLELDLLMKRRCREYWKDRLAGERVDTLKQSKEYWNLQSTYAVGLL
ncbi:probable E3 ubiquitin-protein ligase BAH1-like isoform X2 [Abrus precatorius]|uniref:RING-type E3 ubiquitin transferase n=1 Tax=Abrus precatorius TaxID=3816 RepID=A0A8B8L8T6_ABRPR|nr:probable E3 ubiquitin-protein ligase BAH1-like isoform X2 [Abrus precatorius]